MHTHAYRYPYRQGYIEYNNGGDDKYPPMPHPIHLFLYTYTQCIASPY